MNVGDQETLAVLAIAEDLRLQLEHGLKLIEALKQDLAMTRDLQKRAEALAESRARELQQVKAEAAAAQQHNERLVTELGASEEERAEAVKEIRRLVGALDTTSENVRALTEQGQKQTREADEARRAAEAKETRLKASIAEFETRLQTMERSLEQRTKDLDQASALIDELKATRDGLEKRVADLEHSRQGMGKIHTSLNDIRAKLLASSGAQGQLPPKGPSGD
jgi:chromosome segregation ATPase